VGLDVYLNEKVPFLREKKVLVLLTDGKNELNTDGTLIDRDLTLRQVMEEAKASDVTIFAIAFSMRHIDDIIALETLTDNTGGRTIVTSGVAELVQSYIEIAEELKNQYVIRYVSSNSDHDGLWRQVEVSIRGQEGATVRTQQGYFAPRR
jgi:VWFA-related protein